MSFFSSTEKLFQSDPFNFSHENKKLFLESFTEMSSHHFENNSYFRSFWQEKNLHPHMLREEKDLEKVPPLWVSLFKEFNFYSVPHEEIILTLKSSGTGGTQSIQRLDKYSLNNVKTLAYKIHESLGMTSHEEVNYLCFTYDPEIASDLGTAFTDKLLTSFTGIKKIVYALRWNEKIKDFSFEEDFIIKTLKSFEEDYKKNKTPLRILGFPAFLYKVLESYPQESFYFGPSSWVQTGGGWKNQADKEISREDFRTLMKTRLGIPKENVRDLFGMVEHGIPYVDCELGNMHIPNYARVYIRNAKGELLGEREKGLIHFLCSYNRSYPCLSVLSTDYGKIEQCSCKKGGPILKILGRAGKTKHKGCAIKAIELLK